MEQIPIQILMPTSASAPDSEYDPVSQTAFSAWRIHDEACFQVVLPENYAMGRDVFVLVDEVGPSASCNHQWQLTTLLIRPSSGNTLMLTAEQTVSMEFRASTASDQLIRRTIQATGGSSPGCVDDQTLRAGDLLCIVFKRINATSDEDLLPIRVFNIQVRLLLSQTRISGCPGRLGTIIDSVRDLFNESSPGFLSDEFILRSMNRCMRDLAQENYWRRETLVSAAPGVSAINLLDTIPDFQDVHQVRLSPSGTILQSMGSFREFLQLSSTVSSGGEPQYYCVQNNVLHVWPPCPQGDVGFLVYHSYLPGELGCSNDPPDPPVPRGHDGAFVSFVLKEAFLRDRHAPDANLKVQQYSNLYELEKERLLGEAAPPVLSLRPVR